MVKHIDYCEGDEDGMFYSMQLTVGDPENPNDERKMYKHGGEGGQCHRWHIKSGDYIERIEYTNDINTNSMNRLRIWTHDGDMRVLGRGHGERVIYNYDKYEQFIGFLSFF